MTVLKSQKTYEEKSAAFCTELENSMKSMKDGYLFAILTDRIVFCKTEEEILDKEILFQKGIEIRVFNHNGEIKWFRGSIDKDFKSRERMDTTDVMADTLKWWDEVQYLDIDERKTNSSAREQGYVYATGGGKYPLPIEFYEKKKIKIRNYLQEDPDTGELFVSDWRLVEAVK